MAYLGNQPSNNFVSLKRQVITGNGGSTYTLDHSVASVNDVAIFVNNVRQDPATYSISGTALTLGGTISSSDSCYVIFLGQALQTVTPDADTITTAMLKNNAVDLTSKVTGILPVANGGTGVTTASALANTGNLVLLNTITTTDATVSDIDFDSTYITSTYDHYFYIGTIKPVNDGADFRFRVFTGGTLQSGSGQYGHGSYIDGGTDINTNGDTLIAIHAGVGNNSSAGESATVFGYIHDPMTSTLQTRIDFISQRATTSSTHGLRMGGGQVNASEANNGISFFLSSGNFASGSKISLYGVKQ